MVALDVLVVGGGFLGSSLAGALAAGGDRPVVTCRRGQPHRDTMPLDVLDRERCRRIVEMVRPDAIVLVHGPSDVTWCEDHRREARAVHAQGAANIADAADGAPIVLISTDHVFAGSRTLPVESDPREPANAYGEAKSASEDVVLGTGRGLVLRSSLVYGWPGSGRSNFFADTASTLLGGDVVPAPIDQWTTPVLDDDVARWSIALIRAGTTGIVHLGGPDRVSRYDWARLIATELGVPCRQVVPVERAATRYACRPANSCLASSRQISALAELRACGVHEGIQRLCAARVA